MQRLSGPVAMEFLLLFLASEVFVGVKGEKEWSSWCTRCRRRSVLQSSGSRVWGFTEVNCLVENFAMADGLVHVITAPSWLVKLIGWFGGKRVPS